VSRLGFEMPKEGIHMVGVYHHDNEVDVRTFHNHMAYSDRVERACRGKAALYDRLAQRIS
jgi:hypothetical protein